MKIFNKSVCLMLVVAAMLFGCTNDFDEINTNPNNLTKAPAENVLGNVLLRLVGTTQNTAGFRISSHWAHHIANFVFPEADIYNPRDASIGSVWSELYSRVLINAQILIEDAKKDNRPNMQAIATVLRVYAFQTATDLWGDVPYSKALQGFDRETAQVGTLTPTYDKQQDIYTGLIAELKAANALFDSSVDPIPEDAGDFVYNGDVDKWKKFCNSLLLRLYIRVSKADPATAQAGIAEVLSNPTQFPIFGSNNDDAQLAYVNESGQRNPLIESYNSNINGGPSKTLIDYLVARNDPRLSIYANPTKESKDAGGTLEYVGQPNGGDLLAQSKVSLLGDAFVNNLASPLYLQTYAEVLFIIAEAANNGWNTGSWTAKQAYEAAITQSVAKHSGTLGTYLAEANVNFDNATTPEARAQLIAEQKWVALFMQGNEAYAEQRRTDFPALTEVPKSAFPGKGLPIRLFFPSSEAAVNAANVNQATTGVVDGMFGQRLWWDVQ
ncbi:SusD/RagB family nutrient-binding outer membrane lipoprotein [uncultured Microscilla sp.]|uniref:SusD/RagB family nutrient-binding outer membrane lipoprotein n=1 Tax=uncultured Microscilla sp. TaxID=432653 RepID=UPI00262798FB|nr:SusD/RagB family nutrient-binding outer membrane lipoprotein [uncultured Microscilla sp.]